MRLLPIIDDTPKPYDHPVCEWEYRVEFIAPGARGVGGAREVFHVSAATASKAKYAAAVALYGRINAMYACWHRCVSSRRVKI